MQSKIKCDVVALIKDVETQRDKAAERFQRDLDAYPDEVEKWKDQCRKLLEAGLKRLNRGQHPAPKDAYRNSIEFPSKPTKPVRHSYVYAYERTLAFLKKSSEAAVTLSLDDYQRLTGVRS